MSKLKIAIIGGGASGYFAAITAAESNPAAQVTIYEQSKRTLQKVKAIIVPEKSFTKSHFLGLKKWCKNHMARYKIPKIIELRKELPKNKMGKILWRNLQ